ncbi:MAG: hypothetical protein P8Q27_06365 [Flavicella sp.]|nr:hypothetical protein [Flavicella sp.]
MLLDLKGLAIFRQVGNRSSGGISALKTRVSTFTTTDILAKGTHSWMVQKGRDKNTNLS